jgi:hypothetical protein
MVRARVRLLRLGLGLELGLGLRLGLGLGSGSNGEGKVRVRLPAYHRLCSVNHHTYLSKHSDDVKTRQKTITNKIRIR